MLAEIVKERIQNKGPISFREFMEMCLYHPDLGYYTSSIDRIGNKGDYYTTPYFTSVFAAMIAKQIVEMWQILGRKEFTIVEYGAGTGALCADILRQLKHHEKLYEKLRYCIIEKSGLLREKEKLILLEKVCWLENINEIGGFNGCVLSNELVDNFSVHLVVMKNELMEVFVDYKHDFVEVLHPASAKLKDYFRHLDVELPREFRTEINIQATEWIKEVAEALGSGFVMTIDYGNSSGRLYQDDKRSGTLVCYYRHRVNFCPYIHIGEQDITSHVNFSALRHWGAMHGLEFNGYTNQGSFLLSLGLTDFLRKLQLHDRPVTSNSAWLFYTVLNEMGMKLKVLVQQKGTSRKKLMGMRFSQFPE